MSRIIKATSITRSRINKIKSSVHESYDLYVLTALAKGFPVFCSVLLPVLYAQNIISAQTLGYIGALFISFTIIGAMLVAKWLHNFDTRRLLQFTAIGTIVASGFLYIAVVAQNIPLLVAAYAVMGMSAGTGLSGVNALSANLTNRGNRFKVIARLSMVADVVRVVFSLAVAALVGVGLSQVAVSLIIACGLIFLFYASRQRPTPTKPSSTKIKLGNMWHNKPFRFILSLEFLDSFSSSQLFVFLPLLFLMKGHSLENSILLQAFTFLGYMVGRLLISHLAQRFSGLKAVGIAEVGLVISIVLLLIIEPLWALYILSFALGVFARGTTPAIKSLAFDSLDDTQMKQGSALHVIVGDGGSALGQLTFGLLLASFGAKMPFIVAGCIAAFIVVLCLSRIGHAFTANQSSPFN